MTPHRRTRGHGATRSRRRFLQTSAVAAAGLVAGCLGGSAEATFDHPAAADLSAEPRRGPPAADAEAIIVVFEDPSCPVCRVFDERTWPKVKSELVQPGRAAFFSRGFRAAAPWGLLGLKLLEAAYAGDPAAYWALRAFYFAHQGELVSDTVIDRTRAFIVDHTSLDPDPLIEGAANGEHDGPVQADEQAGQQAGVRGTPTFFLFQDGAYLTEIEGAPSYDLLKNALGY